MVQSSMALGHSGKRKNKMTIIELEHEFSDIVHQYERMEIDKEQYLNLLQNLDVENGTTQNDDEVYRKQVLAQMIQTCITNVAMS